MTLGSAWGQDGLSYDGKAMRQHTAAMFGGQTGVCHAGDFLVEQQASPGTTVKVAAGQCVVAATGAGLFGSYVVPNDASINSPAFSATGGGSRKDRLIVRVTAGVPALEIVQGVEGGSPAEPTITGDNYEELALVTLPPGTTNITTAMITDRRKHAAAASGVVVCTSATRPASPYEGLVIDETDTNRGYRYDGTAWRLRTPTYTSVAKTTNSQTASGQPCTLDAWAASGADLTLPAATGDLMEFTAHFQWAPNATVQGFLDVYNTTSGYYWSSGGAVSDNNGLAGANGVLNGGADYPGVSLRSFYVVTSGDLTAGNFTCRPRLGANAASRGIGAAAGNRAKFFLRNLGPVV